jgi:AbrB family looped-hinge helix DNA binding protein
MNEYIATIGRSGRVTIPAEVRRFLGLKQGDRVAFVFTDDDTVELRLSRFTLESVLGSIEALPDELLDLDREIEEATADAMARKMQRWERQHDQ